MLCLRAIVSILLLPTMVLAVVPWLLIRGHDVSVGFPAAPESSSRLAAIIVGGLLGGIGLGLVVRTVWQFATIGRGTLAPWDPPRRLVVAGIYRHVRNPMITGVGMVLLGECFVSRHSRALVWTIGFYVVNALYIPWWEERALARRFGDDYRRYVANVPRWIPRLRGWNPSSDSGSESAPKY